MTSHAPTLLLLVAGLALAATGCSTPSVSSDGGGDDVPIDLASPDAAPDGAADAASDVEDADARVFCDPVNDSEDCPEGHVCHTRSRFCVECLFTEARCTEDGTHEVCQAPQSIGIGDLDGGFWEPDPCPALKACNPATSACEELVCTPGARRCDGPLLLETCNDVGTRRFETSCDTGKACYDGACQRLRNNVLLLFDTSGSMTLPIDPEGLDKDCRQNAISCLEPFPVCDDPDDPLMMFTLAKRIFANTIQGAIGGDSQFALQRFPQHERATSQANCGSGWYASSSKISGDDDSHTTSDDVWFEDNLGQALVVPFPTRSQLDNTSQLLRWLDFEERLAPSDIPCTLSHDCPNGGRCEETADDGRRCWYHKDPELRATGLTPLGRSIYYAGEYLRRFVLVDGKSCGSSSDCGSSGYVCDEGTCRDPYRHCRDTWIVVFTDGDESEACKEYSPPAKPEACQAYQTLAACCAAGTELEACEQLAALDARCMGYGGDYEACCEDKSFFHPVVQAKRLAYGLACGGDEDCRGGATCADGVCLGPDQSREDMPTAVDSQGYDALSRPDGSPLSVRTAVLNFRRDAGSVGLDGNEQIAIAGGGTAVDVYAVDPEAMEQELQELMARDLKCSPEDL